MNAVLWVLLVLAGAGYLGWFALGLSMHLRDSRFRTLVAGATVVLSIIALGGMFGSALA